MDKETASFEVWWSDVKRIAAEKGVLNVISVDDPESYRDYYEEGDSSWFVVDEEVEALRDLQQ